MDYIFKLYEKVITNDTFEVGTLVDFFTREGIDYFYVEFSNHNLIAYSVFDLIKPKYINNIDIEALYLKACSYYNKNSPDYLTGFLYLYQAYYLIKTRKNVEDMLFIKVLELYSKNEYKVYNDVNDFNDFSIPLMNAYRRELKTNNDEHFLKQYDIFKKNYDSQFQQRKVDGIDFKNCDLIKGLDKYNDFYSFHDAKIIYYQAENNDIVIKFKNYDVILTLKFYNVTNLSISAPLIDSYVYDDAYCYKDIISDSIIFKTNDYYINCDKIEIIED